MRATINREKVRVVMQINAERWVIIVQISDIDRHIERGKVREKRERERERERERSSMPLLGSAEIENNAPRWPCVELLAAAGGRAALAAL